MASLFSIKYEIRSYEASVQGTHRSRSSLLVPGWKYLLVMASDLKLQERSFPRVNQISSLWDTGTGFQHTTTGAHRIPVSLPSFFFLSSLVLGWRVQVVCDTPSSQYHVLSPVSLSPTLSTFTVARRQLAWREVSWEVVLHCADYLSSSPDTWAGSKIYLLIRILNCHSPERFVVTYHIKTKKVKQHKNK